MTTIKSLSPNDGLVNIAFESAFFYFIQPCNINGGNVGRKPNTDKRGNPFSVEVIKQVWDMGNEIPGYSSDVIRLDKCGSKMEFPEHGNRNSDTGWEIDHIFPVSNHGTDHISNLQPLNWKNNADKGDNLSWNCPEKS